LEITNSVQNNSKVGEEREKRSSNRCLLLLLQGEAGDNSGKDSRKREEKKGKKMKEKEGRWETFIQQCRGKVATNVRRRPGSLQNPEKKVGRKRW